MIKNKSDLKLYLEADRQKMGIKRKHPKIFGDDIWKFLINLRKLEYISNCKKSLMWECYKRYLEYQHYRACKNLRIYIPINVFDAGFSIAQTGASGIVVNENVKAGKNVRLSTGVVIGSAPGTVKKPVIGNDVFFGPHAVVCGDVSIADGVVVGANSYVSHSIIESNVTVAGAPAKVVSHGGIKQYYVHV